MAADRSLIDTIMSVLTPIHRDGHKFVALFGLGALVLFWISDPLGWVGVVATLWCAYFFRDPERFPPDRDDVIVSPADGRVSMIEVVPVPKELGIEEETRLRISIFLSVFDVHINRAPVAGRISRMVYIPGKFLNAELDKASDENERQCMTIETTKGKRIGCVAIAGLVARRIVTFVSEGTTLSLGERFGLIRFGSRTDVYLPADYKPLVRVGQRAIGGETVLAEAKP